MCTEDGIKEFLNPNITESASAIERMNYIKDLINSYFNPATPLGQATGGSSMGRSDAGASEMMNNYINNILAWIEDAFERLFNEMLEINGYKDYHCEIYFPRASNRADSQITADLTLLSNKGAITLNELRKSTPAIQFPEVTDNPAFNEPIPVGSQNPFSGGFPGASPVGNVQAPVKKTDAYRSSLDEMTEAIEKARAEVLGAVREHYPHKTTVSNIMANSPEIRLVEPDPRKDGDYDREELDKGIKVELEHTKNRDAAKKIAKDHLDEDKRYYTHLIEMEEQHKNDEVKGRLGNK